jgi:hypothetical protein
MHQNEGEWAPVFHPDERTTLSQASGRRPTNATGRDPKVLDLFSFIE